MPRSDRPLFLYLLGAYADIHGQPDRALVYFKQCMGYVHFADEGRTLAGAELTARGILPDSYKAAIWEKPSESTVVQPDDTKNSDSKRKAKRSS